jgi:hypothetical protein
METLLIVFVVLKLTGVIAWGWFWVLSPLWLPLLVVSGLTLISMALGAIRE